MYLHEYRIINSEWKCKHCGYICDKYVVSYHKFCTEIESISKYEIENGIECKVKKMIDALE